MPAWKPPSTAREPNIETSATGALRAYVPLIDDHASLNAHIVLDEDETMVRFDNQKLIEYTRAARLPRHTALRAHKRSHTDALLAIPDAIAWCWAKGGEWRKLIQPAITATREV